MRHNVFHGYEARSIGFAAVSELQETFILFLAAFLLLRQTAGSKCWQLPAEPTATVAFSDRFGRKTNDELGSLGLGRRSLATNQEDDKNMGEWDVYSLGNDRACDWSSRLEQTDDLSLVTQALDRVLAQPGDLLDADDAREAVAAAEVIARLRGHPDFQNSYTERVDKWAESHPLHPSPELVEKALAAIDRIRREPSELLALWLESDDYWAWHYALDGLKQRIEA